MGPQEVKVAGLAPASGSAVNKLHGNPAWALGQAGTFEGGTLDFNSSNTYNVEENSLLASYYMESYLAT